MFSCSIQFLLVGNLNLFSSLFSHHINFGNPKFILFTKNFLLPKKILEVIFFKEHMCTRSVKKWLHLLKTFIFHND
jgi:hypothetical protein